MCRFIVPCNLLSSTSYKPSMLLCLMARTLVTTISTLPLMILLVLKLPLSAYCNQVCNAPKKVKNTKINLFPGSFEVNSHLRYICEDGFKRQAGTSNIAICQLNAQTNKVDWKYGNISCIRDPLISITTPRITKSPFTTSVEIFTILSSTPAVTIQETPYTEQDFVTQTTQTPGNTPVSPVNDHTAPEGTHYPGIQLLTQTLLPKNTVRTMAEHTTVLTRTTETVMQDTSYSATGEQSTANTITTPVQTADSPDTPAKNWEKSKTIAIGAGTVVVIIFFCGLVFLVICYRRRYSRETCSRYKQNVPMDVQICNPEKNSASELSHEESEEVTFL
ncbi:interleukin-15 receptor subunit alpha [Engystomops pustulosus]|uniref:interleukin-15 receptor subunit alpha n=1 Tax=Engystomops pustulosus TaxID=76066 RepID=UPI003AFB16CA